MEGGMIVSNQTLDKKVKLTAGMQKLEPEQIVVNSEFEGKCSDYHLVVTSELESECSDYHFEIIGMDCESKEIYSRNIMREGCCKKITHLKKSYYKGIK